MDDSSDAAAEVDCQQLQALEARIAALEQELAERRQQVSNYAALADAAACGLMVAREPDAFVYVNQYAADMTGYTVPELSQLGPLPLIHPAQRGLVQERFHARLAGQDVPSRYETVLLHRDGRPIPVEISGARVTWQRRPANMVLIHDLTEVYRTRERIRAVNTALHGVLSITDELMVCTDTDLLLRRAVELARERLGIERCSIHLVDGQLMRGTYGTSLDGQTTDERGHAYPAGDYWARIREHKPGGARWLLRDAAYREWTNGTMAFLGESGVTACTSIQAETRALGVFYNDNAISGRPLDAELQDVVALYCSLLGNMLERQRVEAALRQSELRFREMSDLLPDIIFETDAKQRITYVNQAGFAATGYDPSVLLRTARIADFLTDDQNAAAQQRFREMADGAGPVPTEYHLRRADGSLLPVEVRTVPRFAPDGSLLGYRGVARDLTERLRVEQAQRMATTGELAASLAHDFGNILTSMSAWAHTVQRRGDSASWQGLLDTVLHGCERGGALCWNLMRLSEPPMPRRQPIALESPLESALAMAGPELQQHSVEVIRRYHALGDEGVATGRVLADPGQMEQVFLNLIINACHAMPDGGELTVEVEHFPGADSPGQVRARISDTGVGIPVENLQRVFEPFFSTKTGNGTPGGHGLGLSVSYGLVHQHGGALTVQSELGVGTTFEVCLDQYVGPLPTARAHTCVCDAERRGSVLLAAEDEETCAGIAAALEAGGYDVAPARGPRHALELLESRHFDLLIADLHMPGDGAVQILAAARSGPAAPPAILVAAQAGQGLARDLLRWGAHRCFCKPVDLDELLHCVHALLGAQEP